MKTKLALAIALVAALALALFLVGCGSTAQTHPRTVKDVDLSKYADMEVGNLVVVFPDGTEKKYDVAADFWREQVDDSVWFYDEYKYALVIEKGVFERAGGPGGHVIYLRGLTRVVIGMDTVPAFKRGDIIIVCGNIADLGDNTQELDRNTQAIAA